MGVGGGKRSKIVTMIPDMFLFLLVSEHVI